MGLIKFKGQVIYRGDLADYNIDDGWCNSMGEYYPSVRVFYVVNSEIVLCKHLDVEGFKDPAHIRDFEVQYDKRQNEEMQAIYQKRKDEEESERFDLHKTVRVVRGRKVPIGTEGQIMWMGESYGQRRIGIRLADGTVAWTALANVELVIADKEFERLILGSDGK